MSDALLTEATWVCMLFSSATVAGVFCPVSSIVTATPATISTLFVSKLEAVSVNLV